MKTFCALRARQVVLETEFQHQSILVVGELYYQLFIYTVNRARNNDGLSTPKIRKMSACVCVKE